MTDGLIQLPPDGSGKMVDCQMLLNSSGQMVYRQTVTFGDPSLIGAIAAVKPASTAAVATDGALVVALSPNSPLPNFSSTQTFNIGTAPAITVNWSGQSVAVSNFPATQPVSLASLPALPAGSNTVGNVGLIGSLPAFAATPTFNLGTAPTITVNWSGQSVSVSNFPTTQAVSIASLPALPAGSNTVGNVGLIGSLPAFAATPTFNIGTAPTLAVNWSGQSVAVSNFPTTQPASAADGAIATQGATTDAAWGGAGAGTLVAILKAIWTKLAGSLSITGSVGVNNKPVGSAAIAASQASIGTAATQIVAARLGAAGTGRISVTLENTGAATVYFGASGVTTTTGMPLPAGAAASIDTQAAIYGIAASGTQTIGVLETF